MVMRFRIEGRKELISDLKNWEVGIPKAGRSMTLNLSRFASMRAKQYAQEFSASGTLSKSIRPQKISKGWEVVIEDPAGRYAESMETGFDKPRYLTRKDVSFAGYTVGEWMNAHGFPPTVPGMWVGRGKGMPTQGYRFMQRGFRDAVRKTPQEIRKELDKVMNK